MIFVFGSNEAGIHGAGAAKYALKLGAKMHVGFGHQGKTFAIPTKDWRIGPMDEAVIKHYVDRFIEYARQNPKQVFQVTCIGCGLAGHSHKDMAAMFRMAPKNCWFDDQWKPFLEDYGFSFWGTF